MITGVACYWRILKMAVLLKGGRVIDPSNELDKSPCDVLIEGDKIAKVGEDLPLPEGAQLFDASGCVVCPGLVDMHVHVNCFPGGTILGVDPDEWCLKRGVTTVVDAGSAGAGNFEASLSYSKSRKIRIFYLLHVSRIGLEGAGCASDEGAGLVGEINDLEDVNVQECLDCIARHPDVIVGVKIRLDASISNNGKNETEAYRRALSTTKQCKLPLMVHHTFSTIPVEDSKDPNQLTVPGSMVKGDIRTHMMHGFVSSIVDKSTMPPSLHPSVLASRERGVLHDIGHGQGSFSWATSEICAEHQFWPDTISSDHHSGNISGPAYDLSTVMTRMLHLGMPLYEIIKAVTVTPARAIRREGEIGSLSPGRGADVTVLRVSDCDVMLEDCLMVMRRITRRFQPVAVWKDGERIEIREQPWAEWPNTDKDYLKNSLDRVNSWQKK